MKSKKKKSGNGKYFVIGLVVSLILGGIFLFSGGPKYSQVQVDDFAKCITESGAVMYGTFWCPHCANTKKSFGGSFQYIDYVECDPRGENEQSELCIEKEILEYDTWEFVDGSRLISEPSFQQLSDKTGCPLPLEK
jgi:hypothetical protein